MKNTSLSTLLIVSVIAFSLNSCGGGSSSKKSTTPTGGTDGAGGDGTDGTGGTGGDGTGGDGGTGDPITYICTDTSYEPVHDVASLKEIGKNAESMAKSYCLAKDIDLAGVTSGFPLGWNTVEANITAFTGNFDGGGKTISGLTVDKATDSYIGLFAKLGEAGGDNIISIKNLNLVDFNIKGAIYVGALAGETRGKIRITNVIVKNSILYSDGLDDDGGIYSNIGGLIGIIHEGGEVNNSSVIGGTVTGKGVSIGGLVGHLQNSKVLNSNATSAINGITNVGGLIGRCERQSTVSNSYATGAVNGNSGSKNGNSIGGLVGSVSETTIKNSYATGNIIAISDNVGGLLGSNYQSKITSNNYATGNVTGADIVGGLIGQIYDGGKVLNSYATGMVTATGDKGGLVGKLGDCTEVKCSVTNSYFDKSGTNSGINAIGAGVGTKTGLVGVAGADDIVKAADGSSNLKSTTATKIFVDWNKDANANIWQFATGAWPTFLHSK